MTIPTITEYLGVVPDRREQSAEAFTQAAITWTDYQADTFIPSINTTVESMNLAVIAVNDDVALSVDAAATASSSANYQGDWFVGAEVLKGQSWSHDGLLWRAKQNSVAEPAEGSFWLLINAAKTISTKTSESAQDFIDSFALKIFQSPTGGLTEISTRTVSATEVFEVRKFSDGSLATIYSDAAGTTEIDQDGESNVSGSDGVVKFFVGDGNYYIVVDTVSAGFGVSRLQSFVMVSDMKAYPLLAGRTVQTSGYFTWGDLGGALYIIKTAAQATADGDVIDEKGNHTLTNGNVAILISERTNLNYGCVANGVIDDTEALQALDAAGGGLITKGVVRVLDDIALVSNYTFAGNGIIAPDSLYTITWSGSIKAGDYKIFDGNFALPKVHKLDEVRITWFGAVSANLDTDMGDVALANANARAIRQANAMTSIGIPNGIYVTPVLLIPTGLFLVDDDDDDGKIIDCGSYATILGKGWSSVLRPVNNGKAFSMIKCDTDSASNINIDKLHIYGEASLQSATQHGIDISPPSSPVIYSHIGVDLHVKEMNGNGIRVTGAGMDNSMIEPRLVRDCTLHNLLVTACDRLTVQNGIYRTAKAGNSGAVFDSPACLSGIIRNNQFDENNENGLLVTNTGGRFDINNNRCSGNFNGHGMLIDRCDDSQVTNNQCEQNGLDGLNVDACERLQVNGNHSRSNQRYGIVVGSVVDSQIHGNNCYNNSLSAVNTYDGINVQSNSDRNSVQLNTVRGTSHRYGLSVDDSFSADNLVTNNDLINSGATGSFNDNGTGTITVAGNRV